MIGIRLNLIKYRAGEARNIGRKGLLFLESTISSIQTGSKRRRPWSFHN